MFCPLAALAEQSPSPAWMGDADIRRAFAGQTIDGHYANGQTFTESYLAGGRIDYREQARTLTGRWSVEAGTFCTIYDTSPTGGCFRVRQLSANCYEFYFVARDESEAVARPGKPSWTARGWHNDKRSTCEEGANV
jgi:hypothetical protein